MEKRDIARTYIVEWLGLPQWLVGHMFEIGGDDTELSNYYGHPRVQAHILCDRYLGIEPMNTVLIDEPQVTAV